MKKLLNTMRIALPLCLLGSAGVVHAMTGPGAASRDAGSLLPADANADQGATSAGGREAVAHFGRAVGDAGLDEVRGGFDLGNGLLASLGIQQVAYINGNLVASTSINIPDIAQMTSQQALALAGVLGNLNLVIQNGPDNSIGSPSTVQDNVAATPSAGASGSTTSPSSATPVSSVPSADVSLANTGVVNSASAASLSGLNSGLATIIQNSLNNQSIRTLTTVNISVNTLQIMHGLNLQNTLQSAQMLSLGR